MPLKRCQVNNQQGWKWGDSGKCFTGKDAKEKAAEQGRAIEASKSKGWISQAIAKILEKLNERL